MNRTLNNGRVRCSVGRVTLALISRAVALAALSGLAACGQSGSANRAEVRSISIAIDRLRDAPNHEKAPKLEELKHVPCTLADACQLRDRCVGAYQLQIEALGEIVTNKEGMNPDTVAGIGGKLEAARQLAHECLESELVVGRRYGTQI